MIILTTVAFITLAADPPLITIDRDNVEVTQSCRVRIAPQPIIDADGNGVMHIAASDIAVEFVDDSPALIGVRAEQLPDSFSGTGIAISGRNVTLSGVKVSGFKVGIHAKNADGLTVHHCDVSGNFAQRLKSTPRAEDGGDWLWPHNNDSNEWITNYGAGLCVEDSKNVTLHDVRARRTQNGIILDAVDDSKVYDCDCSFLSGWGLAMWRSSRNTVSRNAFDFCVRGYSHGVYNRGQDSAGILMFEQCCENVIAENSCTHGGDGFFGFAGKEALGESKPRVSVAWYKHRGNDDNTFVGNDFSFAAAHGLELTFSFQNRISENFFRGNAICGIWAGYSQATIIDHNQFSNNGEGAYGLERGAINIEHGRYNMIAANRFEADECGVHLWWDDDKSLLQTPWGKVNEPFSSNNFIVENEFHRMPLAMHLRETTLSNVVENRFIDVMKSMDADESSAQTTNDSPIVDVKGMTMVRPTLHGSIRPVGARAALAGRQNIIMTEWGPWDHESPLLQFVRRFDGADEYRLVDPSVPAGQPPRSAIGVEGDVELEILGDIIRISPESTDRLAPYTLKCMTGLTSSPITERGVLTGGFWTVKTFASPVDPRQDVESWRKAADGDGVHTLTCDPLDLPFGNGGMTEVRGLPVKLPVNHFGCIATRTLTIPKGKWRIDITSDDGIRVWLDDQLVIDDWTWHAPKKQAYELEVTEAQREIRMRVEYFELDGFATLKVDLAPVH